MKTKITSLLWVLIALFSIQSQAQNTWVDDLEECVNLAQDIRTDAVNNRSALNALARDYFYYNNPNPDVAGYLAAMQTYQGRIESNQDDITMYANFAANKNANLDVSDLVTWASEIEGREDYVQIYSQDLATAIASGNRQLARSKVNAIRALLNEQIALSDDIAAEAANLQSTPSTFNVRIQLVNSNGTPVSGSTGLQGYWGYDHATSQYFYPDYYGDQELFEDLNPGTYTFGAFNGYFDGASSETITLGAGTVVNGNGEVIVQLVYWSE
jgi:hypothetical protein